MRTPTTTLVGAAWRGWTFLATSVSVLTFLILAADMASAQVEVTVGASIGRGCKSGFEPCGGPLVGAQGGIWAHEHIGLRLRFTSLRSDDLRSEKGDFTFVRANRTRLLVTGEFLYRFLVENSVQPIVGFAVGGRRERQTIRCEGISCAAAEAVLGTEFPRGEFPLVLGPGRPRWRDGQTGVATDHRGADSPSTTTPQSTGRPLKPRYWSGSVCGVREQRAESGAR